MSEQHVVEAVLKATGASEFQNAIKGATGSLDGLKKQGQSMEKLGNSLTKGLTVPILALGAGSLKASVDYESAFTGVRKTVDATEEEFQKLSAGIRDMTKVLPSSAVEIAGVAEAAGQLGIETDSIMGFTRTMIDLGESTNMTADEAATNLARFANIVGMSQKDFDRLGSTVVELGNNLATTEKEIVEMGLRLAGAGKQVGLTEAQTLALAGALSSVGVRAEAGGSAFSKLMINMQLAVEKGGSSLENFAKVAGMSADGFRRAFGKDASGAITSFIQGLASAEERGESAIKILDDMGIKEVRLRDALLRAAGASDVFAKSIDMGTKAWKENIALTEEAELRYGTTESKMRILWNRITDIGITLGDVLAPALVDALDAMEPLINMIEFMAVSFAGMDEGTQRFIITALGLLAVLGPALSIFGKIVQILPALKVAFAALSGPVGLTILGIGALIGAGVALVKNWDTVKESATLVFGYLGQIVSDNARLFVDWFASIPDQLRNLGSSFYNAGANLIGNIWDGMKSEFSSVSSGFSGFLGGIRDKLPFSPPKDKTSPLYGIERNGIMSEIARGIYAGAGDVDRAMMDVLGGVGDVDQYISQDVGLVADRINATITHEDRRSAFDRNVHENDGDDLQATINLNMGGRIFRAFVSSITEQQDKDVDLELVY